MSDAIETLEHDATTCNLCCPHGITPAEAQLEYEHANILRMQAETERNWPNHADPRITARENAAQADLAFTGSQ